MFEPSRVFSNERFNECWSLFSSLHSEHSCEPLTAEGEFNPEWVQAESHLVQDLFSSEFDFGSSSVVLSNLFKIEPIQAQIAAMKPLVADEMFPEGVDVEDVSLLAWWDEIFYWINVFVCVFADFSPAVDCAWISQRRRKMFMLISTMVRLAEELCLLANSKTELNKISSRFRRFVWWWRSVKLAELMEDLEQCCKSVKTFNYKIQPSQNVV